MTLSGMQSSSRSTRSVPCPATRSATVVLTVPTPPAQFTFPFLREEGQKSLGGETALVAIQIVLVPKYPLAAEVSPSFRGETPPLPVLIPAIPRSSPSTRK